MVVKEKIKSASVSGEEASARPAKLLQVLFFLSGMAALAYQVCWQRILFFSFGTDIESTTIIVSVFMLGLGLGALAGGWIADRWFEKIILVFAGAELGIGLFGLASPTLLPRVSDVFIMSDRAVLALVNLVTLLLPTVLMGATLPMLITYFTKIYKNIGVSTGSLYCINTLGAALGCYLTGCIGFRYLTLQEVIVVAACVNISVAGLILIKFRSLA
jgi:predicted membrane-bound spermidine synthase